MFLIFIILIALALVFVKLGALSVWVVVLSGAVQGLLALVTTVAAVLGWRAWSRRRRRLSFRLSRELHKRQ